MASVREVERALRNNGFVLSTISRHGSVYCHHDGRRTVIGRHYRGGTIPAGTLGAIRRQTGIRFQ